MLDSSIIGKAVDYGDYLCVIDSILDYKEDIIQRLYVINVNLN